MSPSDPPEDGDGLAPADALKTLVGELRREESVISDHVVLEPDVPAALGVLAGSGPRTADRAASYAAVVESIREGYLLHYEQPRLLAPPDPDLALLAGDYLYAKGLERLAALDDLDSVRELSDLIALSAQLHAERSAMGASGAAAHVDALWLAGMVALAVGPSPEHERGKRSLSRSGDARPLYETASKSAAAAGLDQWLSEASEAVGFHPSHLG